MDKIKLLLLCPFVLVISSSSCPLRYTCGDEPYACTGMFYTMPYENPIKYDAPNDIILYSNGMLVKKETDGQETYNLNQICNKDTITDFVLYDRYIRDRNNIPDSITINLDGFALVLSPQACCKMAWFDNVLLEFGSVGPDSIILVNAVSVDVNYLQQIYILDYGDSSLKVFDKYGNFISKWNNIGRPKLIKIFSEKVWILNELDGSIKVYDFHGVYQNSIENGGQWTDITAFKLNADNSVWISDFNGRRLSLFSDEETICEFHGDFCYMDAIFSFGRIVSLEGLYYVTAIDIEKNLIIDFAEANYY
ncbi:MAG: hypothetical protein JSW64_13335 [Candidatus Zixiibacteriota bacterium]|nr:MAG: hypothetical protein JSW64_13335 [candidate division Zixibacteria bacterium]